MKKQKQQKVPFIRHYSGTYAYYVKVRRNKILRRVLQVVVILALLTLGYFMTAMLLQISMLPPA